MRKVSTASGNILIPVIFFSVLGATMFSRVIEVGVDILFWDIPVFSLVVGIAYISFKKILWCRIRDVYDMGDELLFCHHGKQQRVNLRDIINIDFSHIIKPGRVIVNVRKDGPLGKRLVFTPMDQKLFGESNLIRNLNRRVYAANRDQLDDEKC